MALRATLDFPDTEGLGALFEIHRVDFSDAVSELYELHFVAFSPDGTFEPRALIGRRVAVHLDAEPLLPVVHGIVRQARRHTSEATGVTSYELTVVPPHWLLTRARRTRIFQARTAAQIIADVLAGDPKSSTSKLSLPAASERLGSLPVHDYRVQYDETDHDFVTRVLAEDGIASFFDHEQGKWVLCDDTTSGAITTEESVPFDPSNLTPGGLAVLRWCEIADVETAAIARRDFDFEKPLYSLQALRAAPASGLAENEASLEDYAYDVGVFSEDGGGAALATNRLDATRATARRVRLLTNFALGAGTRLTITGPDIAGEWLVVRSRTTLESNAAGGTEVQHELIVIAAETPFRPRPIRGPRVHGVETAFVVGDTPPGTVDTDPYGRVKVEFRWDRRGLGKGNPTRWVRVAQAWAGPGYGLVTLPRVGDEVLVIYSQGNPDEPLVIGRVHNAVNVTPLALPEQDRTKAIWKSQSFNADGPVEGFNMILMDDKAGAEVLQLKAQKDFRSETARHASTNVGVNQDLVVGGNQSVLVKGHQSVTVENNASLKAERVLVQADEQLSEVAKNISLAATEALQLSAGGERLDVSGTKHHFESPAIFLHGRDGVQVVTDKFHVHAGSEIVLQSGGSTIKISDAGIEIQSGSVVKINGSLITLN